MQTDNSLSSCLLALRKSFAFTLAEVLITLGIIGVVAAMTMPSLISKYKEKETVTKLKKFYSTMQNAFNVAIDKYGTIDNWALIPSEWNIKPDIDYSDMYNSKNLFWEKVLPELNVASKCDYNNPTCESWAVYNLNKKNVYQSAARAYLVLADGATIMSTWFDEKSADCTANHGNNIFLNNVCGDFAIDLNGPQPPNVAGIDVFNFWITKYGIYPMGAFVQTDSHTLEASCKYSLTHSKNGLGCAAWVIFNENLDYLHCDDLSWSGKTKCK